MKKFWNSLISPTDDVSHKRIIAVLSFVALLVFAGLSAFGHTVDSSFVYLFGSLTGGESVLTVIEKFRNNQS